MRRSPPAGAVPIRDRRRLGIDRHRLCRLPPPDQESASHQDRGHDARQSDRAAMRIGVDRSLSGGRRGLRRARFESRAFYRGWLLLILRLPLEFGAISSGRHCDPNRMRRSVFGLILLRQLLPDLVGRHPDDGSLSGIEILRESKEFDSDQPFLQSTDRAGHRVLNDILQVLAASLAIAEGSALQQATEFQSHRLSLRLA